MNKITFEINTGCNTCGNSLTLEPVNGGCGCQHVAVPTVAPTPNSPCVECEDPCDDLYPTDCLPYNGADIAQLGIMNGDKLTKIIVTLAAEIVNLKARVQLLETGTIS